MTSSTTRLEHKSNWCDSCQKLKPIEQLVGSANGLVYRCLDCSKAKTSPSGQRKQAAINIFAPDKAVPPKPETMVRVKQKVGVVPLLQQNKPIQAEKVAHRIVKPTLPATNAKSKWCDKCEKLKPADEFTLKGNRRVSPCLVCADVATTPSITREQEEQHTWPLSNNPTLNNANKMHPATVNGEKGTKKWCYECRQSKPAAEFIAYGGSHVSRCIACEKTAKPFSSQFQNKESPLQAEELHSAAQEKLHAEPINTNKKESSTKRKKVKHKKGSVNKSSWFKKDKDDPSFYVDATGVVFPYHVHPLGLDKAARKAEALEQERVAYVKAKREDQQWEREAREWDAEQEKHLQSDSGYALRNDEEEPHNNVCEPPKTKWCCVCHQLKPPEQFFTNGRPLINRCLACCGDYQFYVDPKGNVYTFDVYWSAMGQIWLETQNAKKAERPEPVKRNKTKAILEPDDVELFYDSPEFASPEFADFHIADATSFAATNNDYHGWCDPYQRGKTAQEQYGTGCVAFVTKNGSRYHRQTCHLIQRRETEDLFEVSVDYANWCDILPCLVCKADEL